MDSILKRVSYEIIKIISFILKVFFEILEAYVKVVVEVVEFIIKNKFFLYLITLTSIIVASSVSLFVEYGSNLIDRNYSSEILSIVGIIFSIFNVIFILIQKLNKKSNNVKHKLINAFCKSLEYSRLNPEHNLVNRNGK